MPRSIYPPWTDVRDPSVLRRDGVSWGGFDDMRKSELTNHFLQLRLSVGLGTLIGSRRNTAVGVRATEEVDTKTRESTDGELTSKTNSNKDRKTDGYCINSRVCKGNEGYLEVSEGDSRQCSCQDGGKGRDPNPVIQYRISHFKLSR